MSETTKTYPPIWTRFGTERARKSLVLIRKYMDAGMSEMEAGARAKSEVLGA